MFTGSDVRIRDPDQPNMNIAIAFKGASWTDADSIPLMVMQVGASGPRGSGPPASHLSPGQRAPRAAC